MASEPRPTDVAIATMTRSELRRRRRARLDTARQQRRALLRGRRVIREEARLRG